MNTNNNNRINIAIADDHSIFRQGLVRLIESFPDCNIILQEEDCMELLQQIQKLPAPPDICIADISMPDGYTMLKEARALFPDMKILVLSMVGSEISIIRTVRLGANGFLLKGCNTDDIHSAIRAISSTGTYFPETTQLRSNAESILVTLSYQELELLTICCTELPAKAIAEKLGISFRAVESQLNNLYKKIQVNNRIGLVLFALNAGLIPAHQPMMHS